MNGNSSKIQIPKVEDMEEAIKNSGYLMEQRIAEKLYEADYNVQSNPVFIDSQTEKKREYDLLGQSHYTKAFKNDYYNWELICECENNQQHPVVFFELEIEPDEYIDNIKSAGMFDLLNNIGLYRNGFPYYYGSYSSQYCNFNLTKDKNNQRWIA